MDLIDGEDTIHSFVIKIWLEESGADNRPPVWRGHITHVPSLQKLYVKEMDELTEFIISYLRKMGVV